MNLDELKSTGFDDEVFRDEVRDFLRSSLPADWQGIGHQSPEKVSAFTWNWRAKLYKAGLMGVAWPVEYGGRGMGNTAQIILVEECSRAGVPAAAPSDNFSMKLLGNSLLRHGSEEQKLELLPRILSGQDVWCQGYSEPEAGSDLASVRTRAVLESDGWVINGQKIWTSNAANSNKIFLLARTDPEASKHRGISFLLCPLEQPGIEVRPIKMATGDADFCEVFFDDARTNAENIVGGINNGWKVATGLLLNERGEEAAVNPIYFAYELQRLIELARQYRRIDDPVIRSRLTRCYVSVHSMKTLGHRIWSVYLETGTLGPEASISKLLWSEYHKVATQLAIDIMGLPGLVYEGYSPSKWFRTDEAGASNSHTAWLTLFLQNALSGTVYAGTSEIQRNIIAEGALGMPRDRA